MIKGPCRVRSRAEIQRCLSGGDVGDGQWKERVEKWACRKGLKCKSDTELWWWEKEDQSLGCFFLKDPDWVGIFTLMLGGIVKGSSG